MAEKTGWTEEAIISMPFFKILSYIHVFNIRSGLPTDWANLTTSQQLIARENFNKLFKNE